MTGMWSFFIVTVIACRLLLDQVHPDTTYSFHSTIQLHYHNDHTVLDHEATVALRENTSRFGSCLGSFSTTTCSQRPSEADDNY